MPVCCCATEPEWTDGGEVIDHDAVGLSYVAQAAYEVLRTRHHRQHHVLWDVTSGAVIGNLHQTPLNSFDQMVGDPPEGHSDWLPCKMAEIMARTEHWCDVMSLEPPNGLFMVKFREALQTICLRAKETNSTITIRMMFGSVIGAPVDCTAVIKALTEDLPANPNIQLWVGAWRKGVSWNHAKIIAVDGLYLHTGGHNLVEGHYLKQNPVHDLSLELEGRIANDGHLYANAQWHFVQKRQSTRWGQMVNKLPDTTNVLAKSQVTVSEFPTGVASEFPPYYKRSLMPKREKGANEVPVISLGRYGSVLRYYRPSDDAFFAMFTSAKKTIRMALQDLGPMQLPGTTIPVPGCVWPRKYLSAFGNAIWTRNVDVEIVLSNPGSNPGNLTPAETFGNGWTCVDVASEIIKAIRKVYPSATDAQLKKKLEKHLRICYLRRKSGTTWDDGVDTLGLHAKHFIIDDICTYIGSQNLYSCDLAEWGVFIDHVATVEKFKGEYWNPMWAASYTGQDCKVEDVMNGLEIDRGHYRWRLLSPSKRKVRHQAMAKPSRSFSMLG